MKKQSGFTLIELMVVMAIIAILATAGLAAYTGYIKKARDTTRIADVSAMNAVILGRMTTSGMAPTQSEAKAAILAANNNVALTDPLGTNNCLADDTATTAGTTQCEYVYALCDSGTGYAVGTTLESPSNAKSLIDDGIGAAVVDYGAAASTTLLTKKYYELGSCKKYDAAPTDINA